LLASLLTFCGLTAQTVSVDDQTFDAQSLSELLFQNRCLEVEGANYSSSEAVAYFNNNGGTFPIDEGVIIRTGKAQFSAGQYTGNNMSSQLNSNSDPVLEEVVFDGGIKETAFLEFQFTPLSENFSFNFLFASNEYGQYQCVGSDNFAFILTNLTTGQNINAAILPSTNGQRVSIKNVRNSLFNGSCNSRNANLFNTYNVEEPANSTINMRGFTNLFTASTILTPGVQYNARLVIGDGKDAEFDSAVFIEAGSFESSIDLGEDRSLCQGSEIDLNTKLDPQVYDHEWSFNGNTISGETDSLLTVDQAGQYSIKIVKENTNCILRDTIQVDPLDLENPDDLQACNTNSTFYDFNLTNIDSDELGLNGDYAVEFYNTAAEAQADNPIPQSSWEAYSSAGSETIFIRVRDQNSGVLCSSTAQFDLSVGEPVEANQPPDLNICVKNFNVPASFDLTQNYPAILGGNQDIADFSIKFFLSESNAQSANNNINNPDEFTLQANTRDDIIWVRVASREINDCFAITSFEVEKNEKPEITQVQDTLVCSVYILPPIQFGDYYTAPEGPDGGGSQLDQGDAIQNPGTYYIFNGPDENGCSQESSFQVKILEKFILPSESCRPFILPPPPDDIGSYYTDSGGPNGAGTELPPGTEINMSQTIYYYAEYEGSLCVDKPFDIDILDLPLADDPSDTISCGSYTLPTLTNGEYFTEPEGGGIQLFAGDVLTESQTLYVFNDDGICINDNPFNVAIPLDYEDLIACGSYDLPEIFGGGYYTEPGGQGSEIPDNSPITESDTVYFFAETATELACAEDEFFVEIVPLPPVDSLENQIICADSIFILPAINDGEYFKQPGGDGDTLIAGDTIFQTDEIFINNTIDRCSNETSFIVEVLDLPEITLPTNIFNCGSYILPAIEFGEYYTEPTGAGEQLQPGDTITETETLYIFRAIDSLTSCFSEEIFTVNIRNAEVGEFPDIDNCGPYVLDTLDFGNYFTESAGLGDQLNPGDTIFDDQTIYVYGVDGERFPCTDEDTITIDISPVPVLPEFEDIDQCGGYRLPFESLPDGPEIYSGFYREPGGINPIDIDSLTPGVYTVYAYAAAIENPNCFDADSIQITLYPRPEIDIDDGVICKDPVTGEVIRAYTVETGIDPNEFFINWFRNGEEIFNGPTFTIDTVGNYTVQTIKKSPEGPNDCNYISANFNVIASEKPVVDIYQNELFDDQKFVEVQIIEGNGPYEFKIDDQNFSTDNIFNDVPTGTHIIKVRPVNGGCATVFREVEVLSYPKFFTPNQDGINDTWNIDDLQNLAKAEIYIFTRYGKLITSVKPGGESWDGTFNGKQMPSDDYWFRVEYVIDGSEKVFKSNFTLKR
jgi:gliding motility-associated-like protein